MERDALAELVEQRLDALVIDVGDRDGRTRRVQGTDDPVPDEGGTAGHQDRAVVQG